MSNTNKTLATLNKEELKKVKELEKELGDKYYLIAYIKKIR